MAKKPLTHEQAIIKFVVLQKKMNAYVNAKEEAEKAFEVLKYGPERDAYTSTDEWKAVCKAAGISEHADFRDLSC